jgi:hypothetical protein
VIVGPNYRGRRIEVNAIAEDSALSSSVCRPPGVSCGMSTR